MIAARTQPRRGGSIKPGALAPGWEPTPSPQAPRGRQQPQAHIAAQKASPPQPSRPRARQGGRLPAQGVSPGNERLPSLPEPRQGRHRAPLAGLKGLVFSRLSQGSRPGLGVCRPPGWGLCAIMRSRSISPVVLESISLKGRREYGR